MKSIFADRITDVPPSFIREILKVAGDPSVISFAGGLPNRELFPVEALQQAAAYIFEHHGREALQYSNSEGYADLRQFISDRYKLKEGLDIAPDSILITNGSQQGLDLLGKSLLNDGDDVVIEEPGYLGAIQAFSVYKSTFHPVPVDEEGMDPNIFATVMAQTAPKLIYTVPNFQNPAGISYSEKTRRTLADVIRGSQSLLIQDDPYADLRFAGAAIPSFKALIPENTVLLGSFSKTVVPSFRLGWIVAPDALMEKLVIAKQASDLHTNYFSQRLLHRYLETNDLDAHIAKIVQVYDGQRRAMLDSIATFFPEGVRYTRPNGGMFLWVTLPPHLSSMDLFNEAIKDNVAFVPGHPFYVNREDVNTLRLNFSCVDEDSIAVGIKRLSKAIKRLGAA